MTIRFGRVGSGHGPADYGYAAFRAGSAAYDQWTQFESFPRFMEGVESVQQTDDRHLRWKAQIGGVTC